MNNNKKFKDDLQNYVFTTKFVLLEGSPILFVFHDEDGDWQFLGAEDAKEEDAKIIALGEMIEHDPTILEVADLPLGKSATRKDQFSEWLLNEG